MSGEYIFIEHNYQDVVEDVIIEDEGENIVETESKDKEEDHNWIEETKAEFIEEEDIIVEEHESVGEEEEVFPSDIYYICNCGKALKNTQYYRHRTNKSPKACQLCKMVFSGICELTVHKLKCGSICPNCGKKFRSPATCARHLSRKKGCKKVDF